MSEDELRLICASDIEPMPRIAGKWGNWRFQKNLTIAYVKNGYYLYELDLEQIHSQKDILHWIWHIFGKSDEWISNDWSWR
jgi:hypothetical protein